MLRLFIAVSLPEDVLNKCGQEIDRLKTALGPLSSAVSFVKPQALHFTLKFLGDTPEDWIKNIEQNIQLAAGQIEPFSLVLGGLQSFPSSKKPRVIFLEVSQGALPMNALAAEIEKKIAPLGFPTERRGFTAHVTLGRVKNFRKATSIGAKLMSLPFLEVARLDVAKVELIRSELRPEGSRYTTLSSFKLGQHIK